MYNFLEEEQETKSLLCGQPNKNSPKLPAWRKASVRGEAVPQTGDRVCILNHCVAPQPFPPGSRMAAARLVSSGSRWQEPFGEKIEIKFYSY